ncbi:mannan endo-1,4-beta-mannosidase 4 isoform X1 [Solanum lycopersicum]|uniref:mannan endo-1,4-beta-mannosidase 4 isoform X1 n=1 Tax=Solanum lycopersicum TaxID=4081 RepID=UPI0008FEC2B0|nr:mannan endo-1,4-beta-mannosidase 4 isoform X1 [Solanum lycopersicum]
MNNSIILIFVAILIIFPNEFSKPTRAFSNNNFVYTDGTHFALNGKSLYINGFNAYWLMYIAYDPSTRIKVTNTFQQASKYKMNVARTWAFSHGGSRPLQSAPGVYNEQMFQGLDFVISEAKKYGIHLIMSLVNNWDAFGGKKQYVEWAVQRGQKLTSDDDFFTNPMVKGFYKNNVKNWVLEMAGYLKSIDSNHLLEIGLEGFYGNDMRQYNPNSYIFGTNFISNNQVQGIDFTTIHMYPNQWLPGLTQEAQDKWASQWIQVHIDDSKMLKKPLLIAEFGKSTKTPGYTVAKRDNYFEKIYGTIFNCAKSGGPCGGGLFWQVLGQGMSSFDDGYQVVLQESPSTSRVILLQSLRLSKLS